MLTPIGIIETAHEERYQAPRQPRVEEKSAEGVIRLFPGMNFEQALEDLEGFEFIWLIFWFHRNTTWKPKVLPPRGSAKKRGVFATRSPHRPNPIGLSLVRLLEVSGRTVRVGDCDILDGTPILDIKPYLPHIEAYPDAAAGWLGAEPTTAFRYEVAISEVASLRLSWLRDRHGIHLAEVAERILRNDPFPPHPYKRIRETAPGLYELAITSWRLVYSVDGDRVVVESVVSGYSADALASTDDESLHDSRAHREFHLLWPNP
jgi:tRNA-Thr(GGU) m(6)t(6)A37 methyltransferase TsaA